MHIRSARELLFGPDGLIQDAHLRKAVDARMEALIRGTDILTQSSFLSAVDTRLSEISDRMDSSGDPDDRCMVLSLLLQMADVFHPLRPFHIHKRWAMSIAQEFALQGKMEEELGQETTPLTNTHTYVSTLGASTTGFIDFVVIPLTQRLQRAFPELPSDFAGALEAAKVKWRSYDGIVVSRSSWCEEAAGSQREEKEDGCKTSVTDRPATLARSLSQRSPSESVGVGYTAHRAGSLALPNPFRSRADSC